MENVQLGFTKDGNFHPFQVKKPSSENETAQCALTPDNSMVFGLIHAYATQFHPSEEDMSMFGEVELS